MMHSAGFYQIVSRRHGRAYLSEGILLVFILGCGGQSWRRITSLYARRWKPTRDRTLRVTNDLGTQKPPRSSITLEGTA